jgi:hypothetical protein
MRRPLLAALTAALLTPAAAYAAPAKPVCLLIRDAVGDTSSPVADSTLDSQLDITSADVATNGKVLTTVLRLNTLTADDAANPQGRIYEFDFTAQEKNFIVMASLLPGGNDWSVFISASRLEENQSGARAATGIGQGTGIVDTFNKEVRVTVPLSVFKPYANLTSGTDYYLSAFTYRANGESLQRGVEGGPGVQATSSFGIGVDQAWGRKAYYRNGAKSCVRTGR